MEDRKYFFRNNNYTIIEMIERLDVDDLANDVIEEDLKSKSDIKKRFFEIYSTEPEIKDRLKNIFDLRGRKGDKGNIRLYDFCEFKNKYLDSEGENIILSLKGKILNDEPLLGSFLSYGMGYIEDVKLSSESSQDKYIDIKFCFKYEKIVQEGEQLGKYFSEQRIETRYYRNEKILAVTDGLASELNIVCSIILTIPYYINIKKGNEATYAQPIIKPIKLNSSQLESVKKFLGGNLKSTVLRVDNDRGTLIRIEGRDKDFEQYSTVLKENEGKGEKQEVQFYWKMPTGLTNKITIKGCCQIVSTGNLLESDLKSIIDTIQNVSKKEVLLVPLIKVVKNYCEKTIRKALAKRAYTNKFQLIMGEIKEIINKIIMINSLDFTYTDLYCEICINILIQSIKNNMMVQESINYERRNYDLFNAIKIYLEMDDISNSSYKQSIDVLNQCIKVAGENEQKLMKMFEEII